MKINHGALALVSMIVGWCSQALVYYVTAFHAGFHDVIFWFYWTGLFIFVAWLVVFLPLTSFVSSESVFFSPRIAPLFGAVTGWGVSAILLGTFFGELAHIRDVFMSPLTVFGAITGATTGLAYSLLVRVTQLAQRISKLYGIIIAIVLCLLVAFPFLWKH